MSKINKYLNEEKYRIEIKGITHDWMSLDVAKFDPKGKRYSKIEAEKAIKKAIKAGRGPNTIRMVKEEKIDILDRLEIEDLINETKEFIDDDELNEKAVQAAGWGKGSVEKFGKTIGHSPYKEGFFDACVMKMKGKKDWDKEKAEGFCARLIDTVKGSTDWRGKKE